MYLIAAKQVRNKEMREAKGQKKEVDIIALILVRNKLNERVNDFD